MEKSLDQQAYDAGYSSVAAYQRAQKATERAQRILKISVRLTFRRDLRRDRVAALTQVGHRLRLFNRQNQNW